MREAEFPVLSVATADWSHAWIRVELVNRSGAIIFRHEARQKRVLRHSAPPGKPNAPSLVLEKARWLLLLPVRDGG